MLYRFLTVSAERDGAVLRLRLSGRALTRDEAHELSAAACVLGEDRAVRVVVIDSAGPDFCAGAADDLDRLGVTPDPASALAALRPPVIAAISGRCASVGLELALACDVRVCTPGAELSLPDVTQGVLPCWGGTQRLPRLAGSATATAMILLGSTLTASSAKSCGLVFDTAEDISSLESTLIDELLGAGPLALELAKEAIARGSEMAMRDGLRLEGDLNHLLQSSDDRAEGLAAFFAKRPPDFAGR